METRNLGGLPLPAVGLGCMGMSELYGDHDDDDSIRVIQRALELGVNLLDTADVYGVDELGAGHNERLIARALRGRREQAIVATKFGNIREADGSFRGVDGTAEHVHSACDASLSRLGVEYIDLYQLHRVDPGVPIEETVGAMYDLVQAGKVRFLGLSEAQPSDIERAAAVAPIATLQTEYSLFERHVENEVLATCASLGIGFLAYAPLGRGLLTGRFRSHSDFQGDDYRVRSGHPRFDEAHLEANAALVATVEAIGHDHGVAASTVALAWLLHQQTWIVPIPGTKRIKYLEQNAASADLRLSPDEVRRLDALVSSGGSVPGERYPGGRTPTAVSAVRGAE